jgi:tRNA-2-methylthio-N6-dimethylallyladenosine synthase
MEDDVPEEEKRRRFHIIEQLQKEISERKMLRWRGEMVDVLVEETHKGRWRGRNPQGKLVFFDDPRDLMGQMVKVNVTYTGPWSMSGVLVDEGRGAAVVEQIPLTVI